VIALSLSLSLPKNPFLTIGVLSCMLRVFYGCESSHICLQRENREREEEEEEE
jgi:hypothetical protein